MFDGYFHTTAEYLEKEFEASVHLSLVAIFSTSQRNLGQQTNAQNRYHKSSTCI
jgi:hypothetical protein